LTRIELTRIDGALRNSIVLRNAIMTGLIRIAAATLSFFLVPLLIAYLGVEKYGIWMTALSVLYWLTFFDFGIGNGLRNRLSEALSRGDIHTGKELVSTAYAVIGIFFVIVLIVGLGLVKVLDWRMILNTAALPSAELAALVSIVLAFALAGFWLSLSQSVGYALQQAAWATATSLIAQLVFGGGLLLLGASKGGNVLSIGLLYGLGNLVGYLTVTAVLYCYLHPELRPSPRHIVRARIKEIGGLGLRFFGIQAAALVIFATDNLIISKLLGPAHVTPYAVVFQLFSLLVFAHGILLAPLWSAYTDAFAKGDLAWVRRMLRRMNWLMVPIVLLSIGGAIGGRAACTIWLRRELDFPPLLFELMAVYAVVATWNNVYAYFLNGIGDVDLQLWLAVIAGALNIPLSIWFVRAMGMGSAGVIMGTIVSLSLFAVGGPVRTYLRLRRAG
jgi:O-antigen/teichoic acid export membrane protein